MAFLMTSLQEKRSCPPSPPALIQMSVLFMLSHICLTHFWVIYSTLSACSLHSGSPHLPFHVKAPPPPIRHYLTFSFLFSASASPSGPTCWPERLLSRALSTKAPGLQENELKNWRIEELSPRDSMWPTWINKGWMNKQKVWVCWMKTIEHIEE